MAYKIYDEELVNLADGFTQEREYFKLGVKLDFKISDLENSLKDSKDDVYRATLKALQKWRDHQQKLRIELRPLLYKTLMDLGYHNLATVLIPDDDDDDAKSLLRTVEVCAPYCPSESSASISKSINVHTVSDLDDDVSMVTSAMSTSDYSLSIAKDSKFDSNSRGSRTESSGSARSTGLTDDLHQLTVSHPQGGTTHVEQWLSRESNRLRIGAPGEDRLSDMQVSIGHLETLKLKDYQVELAEPALEGHNTCVVAPTGTGKTYVAVAVAQDVLRKAPGKKVIFVVNQVPLVYQQSTVFKKYIKEVAYICGDHGQPQITRYPLDQVLMKNDVVVLTAQILVDALTKGQVSLKDIGLIVFDECHETKKGSQYNAIMAKYMQEKQKNAIPLPQILGMTASLGVGSARSHAAAINYMLKMCANMDIVKLSTVKKYKESLEKVVNKPDEGMHVVTSRTEDSFAEEIQGIMLQVFQFINSSEGSSVLNTTVEKLSSLRSSNHSRENFSHILCKLKKEIAENSGSTDLQLSLMTCAQYLKEYSSGLAIHETARTKDALSYLQEFIEEKSKKTATTNTERRLIQMFQQKQQALQNISTSPMSPDNPALLELQLLIERDIVTCQDQENGGSFRAILFTQTIASTWALKKWVMETDSLKDLHPEVLVGCRNPGMNLRHQTDVLDNFRNGVHKLLIATSVIQQGIDVPACNFVYRYNYISDAVARIQARGRTRKPGGRFDLVVHDYRGLDGKDKLSKEQEEIMQKATDEISSFTIEEMKEKIDPFQQHRNVQISKREEPKPVDVYNHCYHCKHCNAFVCHSSDFRVVKGGHHVVIDREIVVRIRIKASRDREIGHWSSVQHAKKEIRCGDERCDFKIGSVLNYKGRMLLAFGISSLRLRRQGKASTYKSWGALPFIFHAATMDKATFGLDELPVVHRGEGIKWVPVGSDYLNAQRLNMEAIIVDQ